jgi:hypothetical protein
MDVVGRIFSVSFVVFACSAALAQQDTSPYSLGLNAGPSGPGLNLSLVGNAHVSSFGVFGKIGSTTYARPDTSVMGMASAPVSEALSWGGGVSYQFTPRLSATFEWISYDLKLPNGPLRSTSLGLKYRY